MIEISRRDCIIATAALPWIGMSKPLSGASTQDRQLTTGGSASHYVVEMAASGNLELDPNSKQVKTVPFRVEGDFEFVQRHRKVEDCLWIGRAFERATAQMQVGRGATVSRLNDLSEIIVHRIEPLSSTQIQQDFFRQSLPLESAEIDLIFIPGISPTLSGWLEPGFQGQVGESWKPAAWNVAAALAIDAVVDGQIECRLEKKSEEAVNVSVQGQVQGLASGVATEITLSGVCLSNPSTKELESLVWNVREKRALGPATPGFEARTKIEVTRTVPASWSSDQEAQLAVVMESQNDSGPTLVFESKRHGFRLQHGNGWRVVSDQAKAAILRYVSSGELIAQAQFTRLEDLPAGVSFSAKRYRSDVAKAIEGTSGQIVDVAESTTSKGYQSLRVIVSSEVSGVPIQWIYYHLADNKGRRVGWVITMEQDRVDRFGAEDQILVDQFEIIDANPPKSDAQTAQKSGSVETK